MKEDGRDKRRAPSARRPAPWRRTLAVGHGVLSALLAGALVLTWLAVRPTTETVVPGRLALARTAVLEGAYGVTSVEEQPSMVGRRGVGTVNHCIHGKEAVVEEVLDWQPYDHVTYRSQLPIPNVPKLVSTYRFEDLGDGRTRVEVRFGRRESQL